MKLRYTERAIADLEAIQAYVAVDNPSAATKLGERIRAPLSCWRTFPSSDDPVGLLGRGFCSSRARPMLSTTLLKHGSER